MRPAAVHPSLLDSRLSNSSPRSGCHDLQSCDSCHPCAPATGLCTGVGYNAGYQAGLDAGHLELCKTSCATQ